VKVEGSAITNANAAAVLRSGLAAIEAGDFAIDFGTVTRCDTSAVAVVLAWKRAAAARGGALVLSSMPKDLSSLAQLYGVDQLLA